MDDVTRRVFVKNGAGAAAALAALGAMGAVDAEAATRRHHHGHHSDPIVAWIGDPRDGRITVMSGQQEVTFRDHKLAERLARAAK